MKAIWNDQVIAESDNTEFVEGNHYFPIASVKVEYLKDSQTQSVCHWKGTASYHTLVVNGEENVDAAWYYPEPLEAAQSIKDHIAFWKGVKIID